MYYSSSQDYSPQNHIDLTTVIPFITTVTIVSMGMRAMGLNKTVLTQSTKVQTKPKSRKGMLTYVYFDEKGMKKTKLDQKQWLKEVAKGKFEVVSVHKWETEAETAYMEQVAKGLKPTFYLVTDVWNRYYITIPQTQSIKTQSRSIRDPYNELESLESSIVKLGYVLKNQKKAVEGTREHKRKLMVEYGVTELPSVNEMRRKYPKLYHTDKYLTKAEADLARIELSMMRKCKRRKELKSMLGIER